MNNKESKDFFSIYETIRDVFGREKLDSKAEEIKAIKLYNRIKIEKINKYSKAINIINGVLKVIVDDNSALQYIQLYTEKIIKSINKKIGDNIVKKISYRVCTNKREYFSDNKRPKYQDNLSENHIDIDRIKLDKNDIMMINNILNNIKENDVDINREIRNKLKKLFSSNLKYNKYINKNK